jgi:cysteine desulfuration protein SufE
MSKTIEELTAFLEETAEELNSLQSMDVMEMYRHLTELGKALPELPPAERTPDNFVQGCTSNVYISGRCVNGRMAFGGSSEAHIVRGYVAILVEGLSGLSPRDLLERSQGPVEAFAEGTNIRATITPSRANAFGNIYKLMRQKAEACLS